MEKIDSGWTEMAQAYETVLMEMRSVAGERVLFNKRFRQMEITRNKAAAIIVKLRKERAKWRDTAEELNRGLAIMQRDRDYWHDMATRGGGHG